MPTDGSAHRLSLGRPPILLDAGVEDWIIRFDLQRKAYRLPLADIERLATLTPDGELAVKFSYFEPCPFPSGRMPHGALLVEP
jgi:hypothetical protein